MDRGYRGCIRYIHNAEVHDTITLLNQTCVIPSTLNNLQYFHATGYKSIIIFL